MLLKITYFTSFFVFKKTNAQDFKLGKVSVAELQENPMQDPAAVAAILFKKRRVRFEYVKIKGFDNTVVQTRIKIYKKGYDWANQAVRYYLANNGEEKIYFKDAATYNLVEIK
jgi:hypothetical protein